MSYFVDEERANYVYKMSQERSFSAREVDLPVDLCDAIDLHYRRDRALNEYLNKIFNSPLRMHRDVEIPAIVGEMVSGKAQESTKGSKGTGVRKQVRSGGSSKS